MYLHIHHGNTGCGVFKHGVQNQRDGSPNFNCVPLFVPGTCCPVYSCGGTGNDKNIEKNTSEKQSQEKIQKPKTNIKH